MGIGLFFKLLFFICKNRDQAAAAADISFRSSDSSISGTVRYVTLRYVTVRYGTVRYGTVRYVRYSKVRYKYSKVRYVTVREDVS